MLIEEKKKIREFVVDLKKPYLGFCLGCQLLGEVIGGKVVKSNNPEIGMLDIYFSNNQNNDLIDGIETSDDNNYKILSVKLNKNSNTEIVLLSLTPVNSSVTITFWTTRK